MLTEFADDHEEVHAIGTGIGLGVAITASGVTVLLALLAVFCIRVIRHRRPAPADEQDLLNDIRREPHYFIAAVAVGAVIGAVIRVVT